MFLLLQFSAVSLKVEPIDLQCDFGGLWVFKLFGERKIPLYGKYRGFHAE
jgi:hypothetical protein